MGAALGLDMHFGLNAVPYLSPTTAWQRTLADASGSLVTIVQGIVAWLMVRSSASRTAFAFLYAAGLILLAIKGSKRLGQTWKDQTLCYLVASVAVSAIVGLDRVIR